MSEQSPGDVKAVLLVDDNPMDARLMKAVVEAAGNFEVTTAVDGDIGETLIASQEWALAIVDVVLPGKDGVDVVTAGRKKHPDLPIIVVSGSTNDPLVDAAFRAGADLRFSKPIDPEDMVRQIQGLLSRKKSSVEVRQALTVVAVGACPGDVEMGCGGVLSKHRQEGHKIFIVNLAGGGDPHSELAAAARLAADLLDAEMENVGEETRHVVDLDAATSTLQKVFETSRPGMLYLPTVFSDRPSSAESHRVALAHSKAIPNVLAYQDPESTVDFHPRFFVDLAPQMEHKLELVALYERLHFKNVGTELAKATARFWGRFADPDMVEPLEIIRRGSG